MPNVLAEIQEGIEITPHYRQQGWKIYAFEVDGLGIIWTTQRTKFVTSINDNTTKWYRHVAPFPSPENPYFYQGENGNSGSLYTLRRYIWPIALSIQGLIAQIKPEKYLVRPTSWAQMVEQVWCTSFT